MAQNQCRKRRLFCRFPKNPKKGVFFWPPTLNQLPEVWVQKSGFLVKKTGFLTWFWMTQKSQNYKNRSKKFQFFSKITVLWVIIPIFPIFRPFLTIQIHTNLTSKKMSYTDHQLKINKKFHKKKVTKNNKKSEKSLFCKKKWSTYNDLKNIKTKNNVFCSFFTKIPKKTNKKVQKKYLKMTKRPFLTSKMLKNPNFTKNPKITFLAIFGPFFDQNRFSKAW